METDLTTNTSLSRIYVSSSAPQSSETFAPGVKIRHVDNGEHEKFTFQKTAEHSSGKYCIHTDIPRRNPVLLLSIFITTSPLKGTANSETIESYVR
jgi:hypothetical protein